MTLTRVRSAEAGLTLIELMFVVSICLVLLAVAVPAFQSGLDDFRTRIAIRYLTGQFNRTRSEALTSGAAIALRFAPLAQDYAIGRFRDGNGNGVHTTDIALGIDRRVSPDVALGALFAGVRFALAPGVPYLSGGFGSDPIRVSSGNLLTFTPLGTASGGSIYLRGSREAQYAVSVFGITGRTRAFKYMAGRWTPF
jgi:type II secretory pathway pseudopilin PulG